jgi:hypothetical protein
VEAHRVVRRRGWHILYTIGDVVSLTCRPPFTPRKIPGIHFCYRLSRPQGHSAAARIRSPGKSNDLIGNQTRDLPACRILPQPTKLRRGLPQQHQYTSDRRQSGFQNGCYREAQNKCPAGNRISIPNLGGSSLQTIMTELPWHPSSCVEVWRLLQQRICTRSRLAVKKYKWDVRVHGFFRRDICVALFSYLSIRPVRCFPDKLHINILVQ